MSAPSSTRPDPTDVVAASAAQRAFEAQLRAVADGDVTVLLSGESGTGKSAAARRIHALGPRRDGPLVELHLGSVSPALIESELFGHERGAFTDARTERAGCFRRAEGGTLVLDDVDLLPLESQVKLLRALQERVVEPVGSESPVPIDLRFVATTNRDLRAEVAAGRFREDLYYRLAVVPLELPPLRARTEDLDPLADRLLVRTAARLGRAPRTLTPGARARLAAHPWPGNVRELENALERVQALAPGAGPIEACELAFLEEAVAGVAADLARTALAHGLDAAVVERALLDEALRLERGNVSAAARRVGLTRRAFEYRTDRRDGGPGEGADGGDDPGGDDPGGGA